MGAGGVGSVVAGVIALTLAACTSDAPEPTADPSTPSTPLASYATAEVVVERAEFCPALSPSAVEEALGARPDDSLTYVNGDRVQLTEDLKDIAHEFGCSFETADGARAVAWVFAPPVTRARAADLARLAEQAEGCEVAADAPAFGQPSLALQCGTPQGAEVSYRGLFGDAWLSCSVSAGEDSGLLERAGRWCVQVAEAARTVG